MKSHLLSRTLLTTIALVFLLGCKKEEDKPDNNPNPNPQVPGVHGCFVQSVVAADLDPQYKYYYNADLPLLLEKIEYYNSTTSNINETTRLTYSTSDNGTFLLDSVFKYLGAMNNPNNYYECMVLNYVFINENAYSIDSADVFTYDETYFNSTRPKGKIYFDFDNNDMLSGIEYIDDPTEDNGIFNDNYRIVYLTDTQERLREMHHYNHNDVETYYEIHTPSAHFQPTQIFYVIHPFLAWQSRYAADVSVYSYVGTGTYTYDWNYQVNADNYIVEQSWNNGTNDVISGLYTYQCYE